MIQNADRKVLVLWFIALGLISWRELKAPSGVLNGLGGTIKLPNPSAYVSSMVVYGGAALIAEVSGELAVALAAGWTLSIIYRMRGITEAKGATP